VGSSLGQAVDSALLGAVFGLFPLIWIAWNAWIYNMTEATGHFRGAAQVVRSDL
jgi:lactate permease